MSAQAVQLCHGRVHHDCFESGSARLAVVLGTRDSPASLSAATPPLQPAAAADEGVSCHVDGGGTHQHTLCCDSSYTAAQPFLPIQGPQISNIVQNYGSACLAGAPGCSPEIHTSALIPIPHYSYRLSDTNTDSDNSTTGGCTGSIKKLIYMVPAASATLSSQQESPLAQLAQEWATHSPLAQHNPHHGMMQTACQSLTPSLPRSLRCNPMLPELARLCTRLHCVTARHTARQHATG